MLYIFVTLLILFATLGIFFKWKKPSFKSKIPKVAKDASEVLEGIKKSGNLINYIEDCYSKFGNIFEMELSSETYVVLCNIKYLKGLEVVGQRPFELLKPLTPLLGENSLQFTEEVEAMRRRAKYKWWLSHTLAIESRNITELVLCFENAVSLFSSKENEYFNIIPVLHYPVIKYSLESLYGSFESPEVLANFITNYSKAYTRWNDHSTGKIWGNLKDDENFISATQVLRKVLKQVISNRKASPSDEKRVIDVVMETITNEDAILDEALLFFIGSFHNVINSIYFTLYYLAKHPDIQERVYSEIREHLGADYRNDFADFNKLQYLTQVIKEAQRITNMGILVLRTMAKDMEIDGHLVKEGTRVIIPFKMINSDPKIFTNPDEFNPDRFSEEERPKIPNMSNFTFGFGRRICPGIHITKVELLVGVAVILRSLKLELLPGHADVGPEYSVTVNPDKDIVLKATPR